MTFQLISLRDANQNFSRLIAAVERGEAFCITRRGQEVARLTPSPTPEPTAKSPGVQNRLPAEKAALDASLGERVRQLEARLDKLSSALPPTDQR
ncbi:type II toxin-antitoxin system Phd/YefM family antitoxin [Polaromonas sp.]|uniref:type II toxin-antitoxin system Phd/YefM family antitoxin n=1 Tax=Polaromonas sp. TaxID=1869339 RepID=UPI00272FC261|nr:type II toxin-antitoxin system prevent-host-death family antitoxin [Polaromonas sp.]MDP2449270.1 type II toxin-antitoxin system prevent-host-death family antitoxin [Polaromonas sp.]MDP3754711.1 type II toxin-antitoxin system prevent-host-death family antitoxin [Polaromonas sp.]